MKRELLFALSLAGALSGAAQPLSRTAQQTPFSFDDIENWCGEGANDAAMAIQWNLDGEEHAMVWGYSWDGTATGETMLRQIVKNDPRLVVLYQEGTTFGTTVIGLGYDRNNDGVFAITDGEKTYTPNQEGVIVLADLTYDQYYSADPEDYWVSSFNDNNYWAYHTRTPDSDFWMYSSLGSTNRVLTSGCWDGWNFAHGGYAPNFHPLIEAPAAGPQAPKFKSHPVSVSADAGMEITLSVKAKGDELTLQWFKDGSPIEGANTDTYHIADAQPVHSGRYHCQAVSPLGEAVSKEAIVKIGEKELSYLPVEGKENEVMVTTHADYRYFRGTLNIPASVEIEGATYSVSAIAPQAFEGCEGIVSASVAETVHEMGSGVFRGCTALERISLSKNTKTVGDSAFYDCAALTAIVIPDATLSIGKEAFTGCEALAEVVIGNGVKTIEKNAFYRCSALSRLVMGNNVESIGIKAFYYCSKIEEVTLPATLKSVGTDAFYNLSGAKKLNINAPFETLPAKLCYNWSALERVELPRQVTEIGGEAFYGCKMLAEVVLPPHLKKIAFKAFYNCQKLTAIELAASVVEIGDNAFYNCKALKKITAYGTTPAKVSSATFKYVPTTCEVFVPENAIEAYSTAAYWKTLAIRQGDEKYAKGIFFVNEDWFGHDYGTVNFLTEELTWRYRAYRMENPGENLGSVTQSASIYGENIYMVSKQAMSGSGESGNGGRLVVADAGTLRKKASFETIGGGDGRAFLGVNDSTGYVSTSKGIVLFDSKNLAMGSFLEDATGTGANSGQIGNMVRAGRYVFAAKQRAGVLVIDAENHTVVTLFPFPNVSMLTLGHDGSVWVANSTENTLVKIQPETLACSQVTLPSELAFSNSWGAWNAGSLCSSYTEDVLYFINGKSASMFGNGSPDVVKYDIASGEFTPKFFVLPGQENTYKQEFYGAGLRVDPATGNLVVNATESGWGEHYRQNWVHLVSATTGELIHTIVPESYYWFTALALFPDRHAPQINLEDEIALDGKTVEYNLNEVISDQDNLSAGAVTSVTVSDETVVKATISYPYLRLEGIKEGATALNLTVNSNGRKVQKTVPVSVSVASSIENSAEEKVLVYPNPARDYVQVEAPENSLITLYDLSGRAVLQTRQQGVKQGVDLSSLAPGVYSVVITQHDMKRTLRLIKK